jgi:hypothetical protein
MMEKMLDEAATRHSADLHFVTAGGESAEAVSQLSVFGRRPCLSQNWRDYK